jgi:hypothetical protein
MPLRAMACQRCPTTLTIHANRAALANNASSTRATDEVMCSQKCSGNSLMSAAFPSARDTTNDNTSALAALIAGGKKLCRSGG